MKTLLNKVTYHENSAYINSKDVQNYADRSGQNFDDAFNDIEQELPEYDFIEEEKDGRIIFHKRENKVKLTYQVIAKDTIATQKTFTRTVSDNSNAYNEFEAEAIKYFEGYSVGFNHPGKIIILIDKAMYNLITSEGL